ncbi:Indoleamine 2,3-dioxygenase [Armillaria luteobubalina]|uniref:Indoleamine 2,3-dioxygenase n=1 Tax=Armillaria luteobubalina TaxID=153913 RepID=A0AA39UTN0_9AGAR|nr:Indoleamine 2,3-dioxygenase [Armillaria luteobubalina]
MERILHSSAYHCSTSSPLDIVYLLPSPYHLLRRVLSLLNSMGSLTSPHKTIDIDITRSPSEFDVDNETGFMPRQPLPKLPSKYAIWELALSDASEALVLATDESEDVMNKRHRGEAWRSNIKSWPILDIADLQSEKLLLQRAHHVLAYLAHYFAHSAPSEGASPIHVPESLAIPLVEVSRRLGIAPILTYADTVLWNWEFINPAQQLSIENMRVQDVFSGTDDERSFYSVSYTVELRGVEALQIIDEYNRLPNLSTYIAMSKVARDLDRLTGIIEDISDIIQSVQPLCDPHVFYWEIRPWFCGSDASGPDAPGWIYDGVPDSHLLDLSGPSGGQSTLMHALDVFLNIDFAQREKRRPAPSEQNKGGDGGFMERMRRYMPGQHRDYLLHLANTPRSVRELAQNTLSLREPYDAAVMALKKLRDLHMRIACRYIVNMSRTKRGIPAGCPVSAMMDRMDRQNSQNSDQKAVRGTGGNEVSRLLKATRDATRRTMLKDNI